MRFLGLVILLVGMAGCEDAPPYHGPYPRTDVTLYSADNAPLTTTQPAPRPAAATTQAETPKR